MYELLARTASSFTDRPAVSEGGRALAYSGLLNVVDALSRHLGDLGLGPGQTVAVQMPNSIECLAALFALSRLGAVILPLDSSLKHEEVERYCRRAEAGALLRGSGEPGRTPEGGLCGFPLPPAEARSQWAHSAARQPETSSPAPTRTWSCSFRRGPRGPRRSSRNRWRRGRLSCGSWVRRCVIPRKTGSSPSCPSAIASASST